MYLTKKRQLTAVSTYDKTERNWCSIEHYIHKIAGRQVNLALQQSLLLLFFLHLRFKRKESFNMKLFLKFEAIIKIIQENTNKQLKYLIVFYTNDLY